MIDVQRWYFFFADQDHVLPKEDKEGGIKIKLSLIPILKSITFCAWYGWKGEQSADLSYFASIHSFHSHFCSQIEIRFDLGKRF